MNDRDTFAAAALTGLLSKSIVPEQAMSEYVRIAVAYADAMLRERERVTKPLPKETRAEVSDDDEQPVRLKDGWWYPKAKNPPPPPPCPAPASRPPETRQTIHDAAPAAIARTDADRDRTDKAAARPGEGTGEIPDSRTRDVVTRPAARDEIDRLRLSEAEIDALEYVVEEGRIACTDDYGVLRSLLVRVRPEWETR
jgi:hypothetical protein